MLSEYKRKKIIRDFIDNDLEIKIPYELWREYNTLDSDNQAHAFQAFPSLIVGKGVFIVEETFEKAKETFLAEYPDRDWNMAEVVKFKGYTVFYD